MKLLKRIVFMLAIMTSCSAFAHHTSAEGGKPPSPWFTGPLLAPTGHTYPAGHIGFEPYLFYTDNFGFYDARWKRISAVQTHTLNPEMVIFYGLTARSDLEITIPYFYNSQSRASDHGFGDISLILGYQALNDVPHTWMPDLKLTIAESFPAGNYENLNPSLNGTDSMGAGAFQTGLAATFQKLFFMPNGQFLRTRLNFTYTIPTNVTLHGLNAYGGALDTNGKINLGNHFSTDLAFEYALTRHWVPAIDFLYVATSKSKFSGIRGTASTGLPAMIATSSVSVFSMAPAIEYNFSGTVGLIVGVWFTVTGRDATDFVSGVAALDIAL